VSKIFGENYSKLYDIFYEKKNYDGECHFLETLFKIYDRDVKTILDMGCGTGGHIIPLIKRGYEVTGVDQSEYMLNLAQKKLDEQNMTCELIQGDISTVNLNKQFDAVISMFSVMGYLTENRAFAMACENANKHLKPGGVFTFDGWYGPALLSDRPTPRIKKMINNDQEIIRFTDTKLNILSHTVETKFDIWVLEKEKVLFKDHESHLRRFLFPQETAYFLEVAGFDNIQFSSFMDEKSSLTNSDFYMSVIGQAI